jgi:flavin-dependent dehydrogenase
LLRTNFRVLLSQHEHVEGCIIKMWPPDLGRGRVLLTGQAGGFTYLNDEGISAAMDSGYRCGTAIAGALRDGGDALAMYRSATGDIMAHMEVCTRQAHFLVD